VISYEKVKPKMGYIYSTLKIIFTAFAFHFLYQWGIFWGFGLHYNEVKPGPCRTIPGINCGSEQISVTKNGLAFITSGYRMMTNCNPKYVKGNIYLFDFNYPDKNVTKLTIEGDNFDTFAFHPHGMDILEDKNNGKMIKLYVVNHANNEETIEVFQFSLLERTKLKHVKTIKNQKFICLNDISVIGESTFYVTNSAKYCYSKIPLLKEIEFFLNLRTATIVYYNNGETKTVADTEALFNGISVSNDQTKIFTALFSSGQLFVFDRDITTGILEAPKKHYIGFHPDNVFYDQLTGNLYIGTQKSLQCYSMLLSNQTSFCYATGIKVTAVDKDWNKVQVEEILHISGDDFVSSVSTVVHYKEQYLVGSVFDNLGHCIDKCVVAKNLNHI